MDVFGSLLNTVIAPILANSGLKTMTLALLIKWGTDQLKVLMADVDKNGIPQGYKMPIQMMIAVCSALATMGTLALQGQLHTYSLDTLVNFLTTAVPAMLAAMGFHNVAKASMVRFMGRETLRKK